MNAHDNSVVFALGEELKRKIGELEQACFDPRADVAATSAARTRRLQLIAVQKFLERKQGTL